MSVVLAAHSARTATCECAERRSGTWGHHPVRVGLTASPASGDHALAPPLAPLAGLAASDLMADAARVTMRRSPLSLRTLHMAEVRRIRL